MDSLDRDVLPGNRDIRGGEVLGVGCSGAEDTRIRVLV